jgi:hypothetical protein
MNIHHSKYILYSFTIHQSRINLHHVASFQVGITLHSFADGNCIMTRLLVNYCLSVINPFPFTRMASREDYVNVICKTRDNIDDLSSDTIEYKNDAVTLIMLIMEQCRPSTLCAMLIRDCWCAWQK